MSTEHVKKSYAKVHVTYLVRIHIDASQIVTIPYGSSHSLSGTSNEVLQFKKEAPHFVDIFCINALFP